MALPLGFALHTNQVWEDFLITFRQSRNLAEGHGLVYQVGERVHGFTSPLNVLLPALWQWMRPAEDFHPALWFFTALSLGGLALGLAVLAGDLAREFPRARWLALAAPLLAVLEVKTAAFTVNGQETGFWLGFLALGLAGAARGFRAHWCWNGLAWAGLMWTRPDSVVYVALLVLAGLGLNGRDRRAELAGVLRAGGVAALLYGPWLGWTWWYYGSPIPHTITAKYDLFGWSMAPRAVLGRMAAAGGRVLGQAFEPIYAEAGGWPAWLPVFSRTLGLAGVLSGLVPGASRLGRMAAAVFAGGWVYLAYVGATAFLFPWYFPPLGLCGAVAVTCAAARLAERPRGGRIVAAGVVALAAAPLGWLFAASLGQVRIQQAEIEDATRREVGWWLRAQAKPGDTVMLEPIGYIGYFSRLHVLDWPGLVTPEVVRLRRERRLGFLGVMKELQPDWLVLRPDEYRAAEADPFLHAHYALAAFSDAQPRLRRHGAIPGIQWLIADSRFFVLRRK